MQKETGIRTPLSLSLMIFLTRRLALLLHYASSTWKVRGQEGGEEN